MIKRLRMSYILRIVICIVCFLILLIVYINRGYKYNDLTNRNCVINYYSDIGKCIDSKEYFVRINTDSILETEYVYYLTNNEQQIAKMVDVGIRVSEDESDGYVSLIGLLPTKRADKYIEKINNGEDVSLLVHLTFFDEAKYKDVYNKIKNDYINYYTSEEYADNIGVRFTKEQADNFILDINFDNYTFQYRVLFMYGFSSIVLLVLLILLIGFINSIFGILFVYKNKKFNKVSKEDIDNTLANINPIYTGKKLVIYDKVFYISEVKYEAIGYIKDIVWVYIKPAKKNSYYLSINLINRHSYDVLLPKNEVDKVMSIFKDKNENIIDGFSEQYRKSYKKSPKKLRGVRNEKK